MKLQDLKNKTILILGFGREGQATLKFLRKHFPKKEIRVADQSEGKNYLDKINNYDVIIKSPGIPYLPEIKKAKDQGKIITSATQIFFDLCIGKIIGVTGTKGKSTTAAMIYEVLKRGGFDVYLAGNIGQPALELLEKINGDSIVVYELSSFQLADLTKSPHIAVITNIYPEHLDHHGSFEDYKNAKANIVKFQKEDDFVVFNKDNQDAKEIADLSKAKNKYGYSDEIPINLIPALYIGRMFDITDQNIKKAVAYFKTLPHRLEFVGKFKGIKFYNDSLSTIPQATIRALDILGNDVETLIVGGFDRGIDYAILGPVIAKSNIKNLILFPTTGEKIWNAVSSEENNITRYEVSSMSEAVTLAYKHTNPGKIALLSPASSSFNLFKDYEDRGNQFKEEVNFFAK
ncbi:UDP-N-acetylmuramoyl-L-alanine--D-glutamate ligase [Candidatus Microgenomates bacterium]|nr:UDP-N-acetylmuramoyl-L-alanine--D-glutamate ligase [Candidatus Microgenomates bacterium]